MLLCFSAQMLARLMHVSTWWELGLAKVMAGKLSLTQAARGHQGLPPSDLATIIFSLPRFLQ